VTNLAGALADCPLYPPKADQIADISGYPLCAISALMRRNRAPLYSITSSARWYVEAARDKRRRTHYPAEILVYGETVAGATDSFQRTTSRSLPVDRYSFRRV